MFEHLPSPTNRTNCFCIFTTSTFDEVAHDFVGDTQIALNIKHNLYKLSLPYIHILIVQPIATQIRHGRIKLICIVQWYNIVQAT